ncbi:MAG: type II toxin-antitoxin system HigB family toxin [Blastocatellia bacterium]
MHVISRRALREFAKRHPDSESALNIWFKLASKSGWRSLEDVKDTFPHADLVGDCTVFNVGGNKYRLVTIVIYAVQRVYVRFVLTHAEYDKGSWKNDCGC